MTTTTLSPIQKLGRLREIQTQLDSPPTTEAGRMAAWALGAERDAILASAGNPPLELIGNPDVKAWAKAFNEAFPNVAVETAELWFVNLAVGVEASTREWAYAEGHKAGQASNKELVDTLALILNGLKAGRIKAPPIVDGAQPVGTQARPLAELIVEALATVGVIAQ